MDRVGEKYTGVVSAVTGFGLFVMLDELYVEGLIHVTGLPKDYYHHEASQHRMVGERTGRVFRLGQKLSVKLVRVNLEERKIDFELIGSPTDETKASDRSKKNTHVQVSTKANQLAKEYEKKRKSRGKSSKTKSTAKKRKSGAKKSRIGSSNSAIGKASTKKKRPKKRS